MPHILMVSAENGALPGGKVGGIGDVVREIPRALAKRNCNVSVVTPAFGVFNKLPGATRLKTINVKFNGITQALEIYHLVGIESDSQVNHYAIEHPIFSSCGAGQIYCDDPPGRPFESDAGKFALFCKAVAEMVDSNLLGKLDAIHLHDWHAAFVLILRRYHPDYQSLQSIRCVYSIHNLAIQGIRPFANDPSSLEEWYPELNYKRPILADPRWPDCINPSASAIRLADAVHTVAPSYAREILLADNPETGKHGGEGLDQDLRDAHGQKRLFGILNGCEYENLPAQTINDWPALLEQMRKVVLQWISRSAVVSSTHFIAHNMLARMPDQRPKMLITSVGRVTDQKVGLMQQATSSGQPALHQMLEALGEQGTLLMLGSGDPAYEQFLGETAAKYQNFIFLCGYSEELAEALYQLGDLFFMPSSFEPCGISQMLALRAGQPCLVHQVGGLRDTVKDNVTGYTFTGESPIHQADALLVAAKRALAQFKKKSKKWQNMRDKAAEARFEWTDSIDAYLKLLYKI